ncbi:MAG TPA: 50S ribosomal protein L11 methyltransferase [Aquihabitans sp.]|nr:50S ribosomal protein L11 methyltransferase [Aquihabitans sp.]
MSGSGRWLRVVVEVGAEDVELAADRLWALGPAAVEERPAPSGTVLLAGFDDAARAEAAAVAVAPWAVREPEVVPVVDDGLDGWRAHAGVLDAPPFVVVPAWLDPPADLPADRHVLRIDPGRTFGSGSHPTTRLVLGRLAGLVRPGHAVLDVGTGSGVLAVAAALVGAGTVLGVDVDDAAPAATAANAQLNGVADRVGVTTSPLATATSGRTFDVVLANLLAPVIVELAEPLVAAVADDGVLIASGLLADRWAEATDRLAGLEVVDVAVDDGWAAVSLRRSP